MKKAGAQEKSEAEMIVADNDANPRRI